MLVQENLVPQGQHEITIKTPSEYDCVETSHPESEGPTPFICLLCSSVVRSCNPELASLLGTMIFNLQSMWFPLFEHMALQLPQDLSIPGEQLSDVRFQLIPLERSVSHCC